MGILKRTDWRARAEAAEAAVATMTEQLAIAQEHLDGIQARFAARAVLISITTKGRTNRFMFARGGKLFVVETYSTMEDDVPGWKRELLDNG